MKPSTLPQTYKDEIKLSEKLSESDVKAKIQKIEDLRKDAAKYNADGDKELALALTKKSHALYDELKTSYPVYQELKDQWKKFAHNIDNVSVMENELETYKQETLSQQDEFARIQQNHERAMKEREAFTTQKTIQLQELNEKLLQVSESPHAAYRNSMVDYAKVNESKETAEKIEKWAGRVEELRVK
jgi:hypothetical protein